MKRKKVFIIHFQPLELFPPAMNMIDFLAKEKSFQLIVVTNRKIKTNRLLEYDPGKNVKILRPAKQSNQTLLRYLNYGSFYLSAFYLLLIHHPKTVWYFETLSSWPALMYKKIRRKKISLMVHYHEYTEPRLYEQGMFLSKWMHGIESKMYKRFSWISHTNPVRIEMFKKDNHLNDMDESAFHVIPNYPPQSWLNIKPKDDSITKLKKLVFVGSLGYTNMYLQEVIDWLGDHRDIFSLDVYSYNIDDKAKEALKNSGNTNIHYCGGCDYQSLPGILKNYDIGLDIYKPFALNHVHGVSNKVFEYLGCGLDVWFSVDKPQTMEYVRKNIYPKVIPVNFLDLKSFDYASAISRENLSYSASTFFYENIYPEISFHILNQDKKKV